MKVFVTGISGQLGHDVMVELAERGHIGIGTARQISEQTERHCVQLDLTDEVAVRNAIADLRPDVVVHCAAWTAVDAAEEAENHDAVYGANVFATKYIAQACAASGAKILYLSTDYVFDGQGTRPWQPDDRRYAPLNYYGQTKLGGEQEVASALEKFFIVRIAWVFGKNGKNFVKTMLNAGKTHDSVRVVNDQIGTPTYTKDLARLLVDMIETDKFGYYHVTNSEGTQGKYISWYEFAKENYRQVGLNTEVVPVSTAEYGLSKAKRPFNSRLDKSKLVDVGFTTLPSWKDALHRYLLEIGEI